MKKYKILKNISLLLSLVALNATDRAHQFALTNEQPLRFLALLRRIADPNNVLSLCTAADNLPAMVLHNQLRPLFDFRAATPSQRTDRCRLHHHRVLRTQFQ